MSMNNPSYLARLAIIVSFLLIVGFILGYATIRAVGKDIMCNPCAFECEGLWTGNACIGSERRITGQEYYQGTTEVYRGKEDQFIPNQSRQRHR